MAIIITLLRNRQPASDIQELALLCQPGRDVLLCNINHLTEHQHQTYHSVTLMDQDKNKATP